MEKVCEYEGSSLWGMNGGQPESPDGTLLVYAKKPNLEDKEKQITESTLMKRNTKAPHDHQGKRLNPYSSFFDRFHYTTGSIACP